MCESVTATESENEPSELGVQNDVEMKEDFPSLGTKGSPKLQFKQQVGELVQNRPAVNLSGNFEKQAVSRECVAENKQAQKTIANDVSKSREVALISADDNRVTDTDHLFVVPPIPTLSHSNSNITITNRNGLESNKICQGPVRASASAPMMSVCDGKTISL